MAPVSYVMVFCPSCGEIRKARPETVYEPGSLEWPRLRALACPACSGRMKVMPEYGAPGTDHGSWPTGEVEWMS